MGRVRPGCEGIGADARRTVVGGQDVAPRRGAPNGTRAQGGKEDRGPVASARRARLAALPADQVKAGAAVRVGQVGHDGDVLDFAAIGEQPALLPGDPQRQRMLGRLKPALEELSRAFAQ